MINILIKQDRRGWWWHVFVDEKHVISGASPSRKIDQAVRAAGFALSQTSAGSALAQTEIK